jgi:hypothetical protein
VRWLGTAVLCAGAVLVGGALAPPVASAHLPPVHRCAPVQVVGLGGLGPARNIRPHNVSCARARRLIRRWLVHRTSLPQDQVGWFCSNGTTDPDTGGRLLCSFGNGGGAPYFRFTLVPAPTSATGSLEYLAVLGDGGVQRDGLGTYQFTPCNWPSPRSRCAAHVQVNDNKADGYSVMVELWYGGGLRHVCWDLHGAASGVGNSCNFRIRKGTPVTFFISEGTFSSWRACWRRDKRRRLWRPSGQAFCSQFVPGRGKRPDYWGGPGRSGPLPTDFQQGAWGSGEFSARA